MSNNLIFRGIKPIALAWHGTRGCRDTVSLARPGSYLRCIRMHLRPARSTAAAVHAEAGQDETGLAGIEFAAGAPHPMARTAPPRSRRGPVRHTTGNPNARICHAKGANGVLPLHDDRSMIAGRGNESEWLLREALPYQRAKWPQADARRRRPAQCRGPASDRFSVSGSTSQIAAARRNTAAASNMPTDSP